MSLINSSEHFPELSEVKAVKTKKSAPSTPLFEPLSDIPILPSLPPLNATSQTLVIELTENDFVGDLDIEIKTKTQICRSLISHTECPFKSKCAYIHYSDELGHIGDCGYGSKCVRYGKGKSNPCLFYHPGENRTKFLIRLGLKEEELLRPAKTKPKFTKMCNSVYDNKTCEAGVECTFAHSKEQLKPFACNFGSKCFLVKNHDDKVVNSGDQKICQYIHEGESVDNYEERVIKPNFDKYKREKEEELMKQEDKNVQEPESVPVQVEYTEKKDDKITLIVPAHMALEIMEILLKNGKTNVEIKTY